MKFILLLFLLPLQLFSQDLSGIWVGTIATSQTQMPLELVINQDLTGYSMISFTFKGAEQIAVKRITMTQKDSVYTMSDDKLIYNNFTTRSRNVKTFCEFSIKMVDTVMVLSGNFRTRSRDLRAGDEDLSMGTITLQKQNYVARTKLISKLDSLKLSNTISFSNPKPATKEDVTVATFPEKDLTAVKVQQLVSSEPEKKTSDSYVPNRIVSAPAIPVNQKVIGVPADPNPKPVSKENPALTVVPEKDLTAVKVQQLVSSEPEKKKSYSFAPNIISSAPAISVDQKVNGAAAEIALRKTEVIRSIDFKADSLVLILYDNGIVDGDTVSIVLNDEVIIPKQGLSERAYRKVIKITPDLGDSLRLVMYAENLGSIPPNTGLLIVEDGDDRQEIRFEGDMKKSSAVILKRRR
ncbi:MAG: hypothetical protein C5B59_02145 [Bacteroidetes bacterium]|nr:MAG: hypothetical protein C5B59_02145 [Bacteroidota bacterium]